jgi:hypothetical protein
MLAPGAPKDNANPIVRHVEKARRQPLTWTQMGSFQKSPFSSSTTTTSSSWRSWEGDEEDNDCWFPTTPEDKALLQALVDSAQATNGKGVALLQNVGLVIPKSSKRAFHYPQFHIGQEPVAGVPSNAPLSSSSSPPPPMTGPQQVVAREDLTAEEVFDIIRNIQDPEHPHTLEQLGVVSLEQVVVHDVSSSSTCANDAKSSGLSTVSVRFT